MTTKERIKKLEEQIILFKKIVVLS